MFADIIVDISVEALDKTYQYIVPKRLESEIRIGTPVQVPFGRGNRLLKGFVIHLTEKAAFDVSRMKEIVSIATKQMPVESELLQVAGFIRERYGSTMNEAIKTVIPMRKKVKSVEEHWLTFAMEKNKVKDILGEYKRRRYAAKVRLIEGMLAEGDVINRHTAIQKYKANKAVIDGLVKDGIVRVSKERIYRKAVQEPAQGRQLPPKLNEEQQKIVEDFVKEYGEGIRRTYLLYGITGSGKTEVYMQLLSEVLAEGKQAIVLIPEIALTFQTVSRFQKRFPGRVSVLHSRLSEGERADQIEMAKNGDIDIMIGPRSALFTPFERLGIIIMDEEHDASYKQESPPRYLTSQVARKRGAYHQCPVVLGSATPSLESYSRALKGAYELCILSQRVNQKPLPQIELIDMVEEMKAHHYEVLSRKMKAKIQETIDKNEQVILLLNKRGYSSYVRCLDCDEVLKCPHCDVSLTYHKDTHTMRCHYCDFQVPYQQKCSHCGSTNIKLIGSGTQKIEEYLQNNFINSRVIRYDVDSTRKKQGHHQLLKQFENQEANILIGTQMIAKGLDFENVTFVGVINADLSLNIPDFRANERTFQLLEQVSGRSGRGKKQGTVMIQTYNPDHFVLQCVKNHDYQSFYQKEMEMRKLAKYPPYCYLISILVQGKKEDDVTFCSQQIKEYLVKQLPKAIVLGPANCTIYKMNDIYRKRMTLKITNTTHVYEVLHAMSDYYNKKGRKVNVICDFNPYTTI